MAAGPRGRTSPSGGVARVNDKRESWLRTTMTKDESRFARGVAHFNAREYFEAHEVWEELWLVAREPEKTFLQGLIQVAAAFHHHARENARGARSLLAAGIAKLQGFPDDHRGIAVNDFRAEAKSWLEEIEAGGGVESRTLPRIRVLEAGRGSGE